MLDHLYQDIILGEISRIPGVKPKGRYSMILCPFHNEKTPSGRIRHDPSRPGFGSFKCYGCRKTASWNELAATLGLQQVGRSHVKITEADVPKTSTHRYEEEFFDENDAPSIADLKFYPLQGKRAESLGVAKEWRGFSSEFLAEFIEAKLSYHVDRDRYYVFLPVYIKGVLEGFINAQLFKPKTKDVPSYLNAPGIWSLKKGLFPFDSAIKLMKSKGLKSVVLVEGPRDALRLLRKGIPAMAILGTHSWSSTKSRCLEFSGVERLILMMDGDAAGKAATTLLKTGVDSYGNKQDFKPLPQMFDIKTIKLWTLDDEQGEEGKFDPGNCPEWVLDSIEESLLC